MESITFPPMFILLVLEEKRKKEIMQRSCLFPNQVYVLLGSEW
jgi:hypothetical protein